VYRKEVTFLKRILFLSLLCLPDPLGGDGGSLSLNLLKTPDNEKDTHRVTVGQLHFF